MYRLFVCPGRRPPCGGRGGNVDDMITTARLRLRRCRRADVDAVLAYRSRSDVALHLSAGVWTREKAEKELATYEDAAFSEAGDELVLLVETQNATEVVGEVGLVWLAGEPKTAEVGYVFNPASGGRGFATEAVAALVHAAFDTYGFVLVVAKTGERNLPSRALCERIGMSLTSGSRDDDGQAVRECVYTLDRQHVAQ